MRIHHSYKRWTAKPVKKNVRKLLFGAVLSKGRVKVTNALTDSYIVVLRRTFQATILWRLMYAWNTPPFWPISEWECEFVTISICCFLHIVRLFWQYKYWVVYYDLCQSLSPNIILGATKLNELYLPTFMRVFGLSFVRWYSFFQLVKVSKGFYRLPQEKPVSKRHLLLLWWLFALLLWSHILWQSFGWEIIPWPLSISFSRT